MTLILQGYEISEKIHQGINTEIYRGIRVADQKPVILKMLVADYPTLEELTQFRNEYELSKNLQEIPGIVTPIELLNYRNGLALILNDMGGISLKQYLEQQMAHQSEKNQHFLGLSLKEFLPLAIQLASTMGELHQRQIVHKDIKPHNIIIKPETGTVKITDFSIASRLNEEIATVSNPDQLEGTLAYMSPEQTGRMNRTLDYRSDYYSLGVTFYEMLAGCLPFESDDPLELIHCHIAKKPPKLSQFNPEIPPAIEGLVLKLMAKAAEERYRSANGLIYDLQTCFQQLETSGNIELVPGESDRAGQLLIAQKLYGRDVEVTQLMETFDRIAQGSTEMMLVSGYSGIGKTALVSEVHKPIVKSRGYFISGKFDQYKRNIPYSSLIQALAELIRQILTESEISIQNWKTKLLNALENNGQVICDVIPEVELIIGKQPEVPSLRPTESQNRFNRVFQQFMGVFTTPEHPLVIFLDDLQWADSASLKLIQLLLTNPDSKYLLFIGAYRDNEVSPTHPTIQTIEKIATAGTPVNNIVLGSLQIDHVCALLADTLTNSAGTEELAELLTHKTQGNPFFLTQLLKTLYAESLLVYDYSQGSWQWDLAEIQALGITDYNVVELIARNLQKLPKSTQEVLKLAACIGHQFNLEVLGIVAEKSQTETASYLWSALQSGLVLPLSKDYKIPLVFGDDDEENRQPLSDVVGAKHSGNNFNFLTNNLSAVMLRPYMMEIPRISYKFLHDRVQQAAYSLIPESQKKSTHLKIGQLLLKNTNAAEREENIFTLVNQLNYGIDLLKEKSQKDDLASLNLLAGKKAKEATAYEAAVKYLALGIDLLSEASWVTNYDLTLALYTEAMEAEYLSTNFDRTEVIGQVILEKAKFLLDRIKVYEIQMQMYAAKHQFLKSIEIGIQALDTMGISLAKISENQQKIVKLPAVEELATFPEMTDPYQLAALRILMNLLAPALHTNSEIFPQLVLTMVHLGLEKGHSALSAFTYSWYGTMLCGVGELETGYLAAQLSLKLLDQFQANALKCQVYNMVYAFILHWKQPVKDTINAFIDGMQSGLEMGDLEYASYCACKYCSYLFLSGEPLISVAAEQAKYLKLLRKLKYEISLNDGSIWTQLTAHLQGRSPDKYQLTGDFFDEAIALPRLQAAKDNWSLFNLHLAKTILLYINKDDRGALHHSVMAVDFVGAVSGALTMAAHNFYYSLVLLKNYPNAPEEKQIEYLNQVEINQQKLQQWAESSPMNFQHKYDLVAAEKARVLGQTLAAMELYDRAIAKAQENEYISEAALANELAAEFYLSLGREKIAKTYITDAYYAYAKWGAVVKVEDLEIAYPQLLEQIKQQAGNKTLADKSMQTTIVKTTLGTSGALDLATVMKASLAISSEIVLDKLLGQLINILLENAGAEKAFLFLKEKGELGLAASTQVNEQAILYQPALETRQAQVPTPAVSSKGFSLPGAEALTTSDLPLGVINYVQRTGSHVMLGDARTQGFFTNDPYITAHQVKSLLCAPIIKGSKLVGIIYLENSLTTGAFTSDRLKVLQLLSGQAAISLELARSVNEVQSTLAYLKTIIHNIADGLLVTDRTGRITQYNPALCHLFGLASSVSLGSQHCHEALTVEIGTLVTQTLSNPTEVLSAEIPLSAGRIGGAVATAITTDKSAEVIGCAIIIRDITAEKEIDRMKTDFISTVSHELRTPLTSVVGFAKIIHKKLTEQVNSALAEADKKTVRAVRQIGDNINIIISEGERLTNLINDVLDIAKMEAGKIEWVMQPVNLGEIIDRAVNTTSSLWQTSGLELIKQVPPELPTVNGDPARLLQVLINLISNAVKFTNQGSITITAAQQLSPEGGAQIIVSVVDTGIGIAPDNWEKVFEKFKQVGEVMTDKPQGTGLGLPICQQIIEHHQGHIWAESELGVGSNFSFALPLSSSNIQAPENLNLDTLVRQLKQSIVPKPSEHTEEQKTILVVDDEPSIRSLLRQQLEDQGYIVKEAVDGMEAISQVKQAPPDLIILDVMMPAINGFDVAAVLKNNPTTMDIPIIILSIVEDKQRGWKLGIDRYLTKPIDSDKLLNNIEVLISRGASPKKVMVVDRDVSAIKTLTEVLEAKGYSVVEALSGSECIQKALAEKPDMIIVDSVMSQQHDLVKTLRFEKGLENVLFVLLAGDPPPVSCLY
jgi:PAS domain S-box-containing protein